MASVGAMESSIASASPASSPPCTPLDPNDEAAPRLKNAWSQIVRGSPSPVRSKAEPTPCAFQPEEQNEKPHPHRLSPDAHSRVSDSMIKETHPSDTLAAVVKASPISLSDGICSPWVERKQVACDVLSEMPDVSPEKLINESGPSEIKPSQQSPVKSPKPAWGKLAPNAGSNPEPGPVMGAVAWPALSEARNTKASEPSKASTTPKATSKTSPLSGERHHVQAPPLLNRDVGGIHQTTSEKSINQVIGNGNNLTESNLPDTSYPKKSEHAIDVDQLKRSGGRETRAAPGSEVYQRGNAASQVSNHESTRSHMWDQGRGNHSFPAYGRGYANARESNVPSHHQRVGHRNLPQAFVPYVTPNTGFVHPAGFQTLVGVDAPGGMFYVSAPTSEAVIGPTYFVAPAVQGVLMHAPPDPITSQGLVMKQIEYYFSVENLCRDIYLRSKMDERGFVPVSVLANFNRVRMITQSPSLITEALRMSNVVEVQGDKVRKKGDWANWLLPASQQSPGLSSPVREGYQNFKVSKSSPKAEGPDDQRNSVGSAKVVAPIGEKFGSHLVSEMNVKSVEDPGCDDGEVGDSSLDEELESQHFTQSCGVESVHSTE